MSVIKMGLVGLGKIAQDEHLPAIAMHPDAELIAIASRNAKAEGVANYPDLASMLSGEPELDAIILCQPPQFRYAAARMALLAGKHVFLEKPPGATLSEVEALISLAEEQGVTLFASWHSRFGTAVAPARHWLNGKSLFKITISWKEDVRQWHPGQAWIWEEGGFGVLDPGINALSILTSLIDWPIQLCDAALEIPANRAMPIAARLELESTDCCTIIADFDWRQTGPQSWDIKLETDAGCALLSLGGNRLEIDGCQLKSEPEREYSAMYAHFVTLIRTGRSDADAAPLALAELALATGRRIVVEPFHD